MRKSIFLCVCTAFALCITSCTRDELRKPDVNSSSFGILVGGNIDPVHNYNLAKQGAVNVKVDEANTTVRIYSGPENAGKKLLAEQTVPSSGQISFDMVPGVKSVVVMNMSNGSFKTVPLNGTADFTAEFNSQTRTVHESQNDKTFKVTLLGNGNGEYYGFNYDQVKSDVESEGFNYLPNASALYYSKTGSFTLNPVWYTSESGTNVTMGIYYYDNNQIVKVPVFTNDKNKEEAIMQFRAKGDNAWKVLEDAHCRSIGWSDLDRGMEKNVLSRGIRVTCPAKTLFGFYVEGGNDQTSYYDSESKHCVVPADGHYTNKGPYIGPDLGVYGHVAMIDVEGRKYLGFDDFCELLPHSQQHPEYWHMVFHYEGSLFAGIPEEENEEEEEEGGKITGEDGSWILACEDLGEYADYDFNDVVLKITHLAGATKAQVSLMAAGGTLKSNLFYGDQDLGEVHALFGVEKDTLPSINTWQQLGSYTPYTVEIDVPSDFTMTAEDMGGFMIVRNGVSGKIAAPKPGMAPNMICVPGTWKWPREMKNIASAYPSFADWIADHTKNLDWYDNPVDSLVYTLVLPEE